MANRTPENLLDLLQRILRDHSDHLSEEDQALDSMYGRPLSDTAWWIAVDIIKKQRARLVWLEEVKIDPDNLESSLRELLAVRSLRALYGKPCGTRRLAGLRSLLDTLDDEGVGAIIAERVAKELPDVAKRLGLERVSEAAHSDGAGDAQGPANPDGVSGFLGGEELADALGVHSTRRRAFFRQLERQRMSLGDDGWHEVSDPRPNSPRFLYRADSPKLRDLSAAYKTPKPA